MTRFKFQMPEQASPIDLLEPEHEIESGWWAFKWKPIKKKTWNIYASGQWGIRALSIWYQRDDATNGWGRHYKCFRCGVQIWKWEIAAWIKWDFQALGSLK